MDCQLVRFDTDLGKHGDTGDSELRVIRAVAEGDADAGALGETTLAAFRADRVPAAAELEVAWRSPTYYHCNFTALPELAQDRVQPWVDRLLAMDWDDPRHRPILEMEGLRQWVPPQLEGYASLFEAIQEQQIPTRW